MSSTPDKRALRILFDTYWSAAGWKDPLTPHTPAEDLDYAKAAGVMFDPVELDHDETVSWLMRSRDRVTPGMAARAFLSSLGTRRLELRSGLGSLAFALYFPGHAFTPSVAYARSSCGICGAISPERAPQDLNVLNFERFRWGGVRHDQPTYAAFDLERLAQTPIPEPTSDDIAILRRVLAVASSLTDARLSDLDRALAPVVRSNSAERRTLIAILGFAGVLRPQGRPGYFREFAPACRRQDVPYYESNWPYPISWWRGSDGINAEAVEFWFVDALGA